MGITDFHNHLIPGVDDGAQTADEARTAIRAMRESGVVAVITTPHIRGSLTLRPDHLAARLAELEQGWRTLRENVAPESDGFELHRGVELALDTPEPNLADDRLRLAGGTFVLVEFPYMTVPPNSGPVIAGLRAQGWRPIIAHPERYSGSDPNLDIAQAWRRAGAFLQINAGSVLGRYGPEAERKAVRLLERGWADYIGSDYHGRGRVHLKGCCERLLDHGAEEQVQLLTEVNPGRILVGEEPIPVAPLRMRGGLWRRFARIAEAFR